MIGFDAADVGKESPVGTPFGVGAEGPITVPKTLESLVADIADARIIGDAATVVAGVVADSRLVSAGSLFCCVPGARADGHDFAPAAVDAGAVALLVERELPVRVPQVVVPAVRMAVGPVAARFYDEPSRAMTLIGVTGTNGKTTTTFMLESAFRALGLTPGLIGTVETHVGDEVLPVTRTTPEAVDLQALLARMRDAGVRAAAMEVSSHGLDLGRVAGTRYACAIFTNLTQDHLDWHGTMEAYFEAKARLFTPAYSARAAINVDDEWGRRLVAWTSLPVTTFSLEGRDASVRALDVAMDPRGSQLLAEVAGERVSVRVPIAGPYNVANALGVLAAASALGLPLDAVARGLEAMRGVPGRLEPVDAGQDFTVLVDYAHTPDSLDNVLRAARAITPDGARLVTVFGCGGDRDRDKRPKMGRIGAQLADRCIITSDNPRSEDPLAIIEMIADGARTTGRSFETVPDRREAIAVAIRGAAPGDVIVIAGKGHEPYQEFADRTIHFDDREVAREILEAR